MAKGADFERTICKELSLWWTGGKRDDIFWRSSQSGGRATVRFQKHGKKTAGAHGDITALDPIGVPLLKLFTIELKRGRAHGEPGDVLDCKGKPECHPFLKTLEQARTSAVQAESLTWLLIVRRDFRNPVVFFPAKLLREGEPFFPFRPGLLHGPVFRYKFHSFDFLGVSLERFLRFVKPESLREFVSS